MGNNDRFEETVRNDLDVRASEGTYKRMQRIVLQAREPAGKTEFVKMRTTARRILMDKPIMKLAVAAAIIAVVVLGLFEFMGGEGTSGVVWAEVARKVQASRGLIVRCTESFPSIPESLSFMNDPDYAIKYVSPTHSRTDSYKAGKIIRTYYTDFSDSDAETLTHVYHIYKRYRSHTYEKSKHEFLLEQHGDWLNPRYLVQTILSCTHRRLGRKTIDGVLCEGIETTDPASMGPLPEPIDLLEVQLRLWVDAETEYPVLFESKISLEAEGEALESEGVMDQFQWDVELDPSLFEPNIPADYIDISPDEW